jgi:peptidoglycan glycosyltransferase
MEKRIRRLGIFMLLCFVALFIQLNNIQILKANSLATSKNNPRVIEAEFSQPRGSIVSADGVILAQSVLAAKSSPYKYQRVYPQNTATLFAQVVGFDSTIYGNFRGVEAEYNSDLTAHNKPVTSIRDLLSNNTITDNVTLTMTAKLQEQVATALNAGDNGALGAAAVVLNPTTGAIEAMYSNPTFDPNPLVSASSATQKAAWTALLAQPGNPLVAGSYAQVNPPGSSFKVVTTSAVLETSPTLTNAMFPPVGSIPLPDTGTPPQVLTNYHSGICPIGAGTLENLLIQSCDADFASIGQQLGATALVNQAELYGFNKKVPLDVPADTVATSNFGTVADFTTGSSGLPGLMKSAIGQQNVTASALQMAMVAGTVANGGVEMTPHVMAQIRDSQGNLVESYTPKPWQKSISPQTAATLTTFMQGVTSNPLGTAAGVFPASWNVAAKTGTAQVGSLGPNPPFTTDWLIAFASVGQAKVAIAVVLPNQPGSATGAVQSGPIVKAILGDVRADAGISG